ncbi:hypothetical protein C6982_02390, partial [Escherichia coli]
GMKKTAPDGAVSGMPAIRETGPGKNLQAITVSTVYGRSVGRIRRSRRIRQSCAMPDATLCASYQAYGLRAKCRPDKAFTPHPAVVHYYQRIFSLLAW